jgi:hypothetical protein
MPVSRRVVETIVGREHLKKRTGGNDIEVGVATWSVILTGTPGTRSQFRLPIADSAVIGLLSGTSIIGCLSSRISGIVSSQRLGMQTSAKRRDLFVHRIFMDARNGIFRHGANSRENAPLISERIVVASYHFHHRTQGSAHPHS